MWAVGAPWWFKLLTALLFAGGLFWSVYIVLTMWVIRERQHGDWAIIEE